MDGALFHYLTLWQPIGYIVLFFGMMIEGDTLLFLAAFLVRQGSFEFLPTLVTILSGVLLGDIGWYMLGKMLNQESFLGKWIHHLAHPFDEHMIQRPFRTIFISKFMYGFHHAMLMRAGALKVPKKQFAKIDLVATISWMAVIGGLGYFFSASLMLFKKYLRVAEVGLVVVLILYAVFEKTITAILKRLI